MKRNNDIESKYETMTIIDFFIVLSKHFKILINSCLVSIIVGLIYAFLVIENEYQSTSKIMSSSQSSNQSQALGIASQLGINLPSTMQSENHRWVYKAILESRTLARSLLKEKFNTFEFGKEKTLLQILTHGIKNSTLNISKLELIALDRFKKMISVYEDSRTSIHTVTVTAKEPEFASKLNNALINTLDEHQRNYNRSKTNDARLFIQERILETKKELNLSEENLRDFRISNRRIEDSPSLLIQEQRLLRETTVLTGVFTTLKQQLENTKIEEVKDREYVIILDAPEAPLYPSGPSKKLILLFFLFLGLLLGTISAFLYEYYLKISKEEKNNLKLVQMNIINGLTQFFSLKRNKAK